MVLIRPSPVNKGDYRGEVQYLCGKVHSSVHSLLDQVSKEISANAKPLFSEQEQEQVDMTVTYRVYLVQEALVRRYDGGARETWHIESLYEIEAREAPVEWSRTKWFETGKQTEEGGS